MNAAVNQLVEVANKQTAIIEYNSMPVITTEQLADLYCTEIINIQKNFSRNSGRFIEGKHYYKVEGKELRELKSTLTDFQVVSPNARSLMLWTEKGAARHAKILDTEQAWEVFEQLEDCYFNKKEISKGSSVSDLITLPNFFDPAEAARAWADQYEAKQVAFKERDHAIATKAEIGNRREATAMATASKFKRQCEKLKDKLGEAVDFAAVAAINSKLKTDYGNKEGRMLAKYSRENNLEIKKATVTGQRFNEVNSYHKDAWKAVFNIDLNILFNT